VSLELYTAYPCVRRFIWIVWLDIFFDAAKHLRRGLLILVSLVFTYKFAIIFCSALFYSISQFVESTRFQVYYDLGAKATIRLRTIAWMTHALRRLIQCFLAESHTFNQDGLTIQQSLVQQPGPQNLVDRKHNIRIPPPANTYRHQHQTHHPLHLPPH
jgi:hypothetical protein